MSATASARAKSWTPASSVWEMRARSLARKTGCTVGRRVRIGYQNHGVTQVWAWELLDETGDVARWVPEVVSAS